MSSPNSPTKPKVQSLNKLHTQLVSQLQKKSSDSSLSQTLNSYAELLIKQDKISRDTCVGLGFYDLLQEVFKQYHLPVMQTICLLLVNLQHQQSIAFLLSHSIISDIVSSPKGGKEQNIEYYISTLKTLSHRITPQNLSLFYNQRYFKFPLAEITSQYYNHSQSLVRTSSMNIIFSLMKIPSNNLIKFFSSFPFNILYLHLVCYVRSRWIQIDEALIKGDSRVKDLLEDQKDFVMLLHDILDLEYPQISNIIRHCILVYLIKPILKSLLLPSKGEASMILGLYLLLDYLVIFQQQKQLIEFVCTTLFSQTLNPLIIQTLNKETYIPKSYSFNSVNSYLSDNFQNDIDYLYKSVILNIPLDKSNISSGLIQELQKIKDSVGYDLLKGQKDNQFWFYHEDKNINQNINIIYSLLKTKDDLMLQLVTKVIIFFCSNKHIQKDTLLKNHLLVYRENQKQYHQQKIQSNPEDISQNYQNLKSLSITYISYLSTQMLFRTQTLQSILYLLSLLLNRHLSYNLSKQQTQLLKQSFSKVLNQLRKLCKSKSKYLIISSLQRVIQSPAVHPSKYYTPNFQSLQIQVDNVQIIIQQLIVKFYQLLKLRYEYIKQSKINPNKQFSNLSLHYLQRFSNQSSEWRVSSSVEIENRSLIECYNVTLKTKVIIVSDTINFIIVKEKDNQTEAQVIINSKYKYIKANIIEQNIIILEVSNRRLKYELEFQNQFLSKKVSQKIAEAKENNINQETVFFLGYLQECLNDL